MRSTADSQLADCWLQLLEPSKQSGPKSKPDQFRIWSASVSVPLAAVLSRDIVLAVNRSNNR